MRTGRATAAVTGSREVTFAVIAASGDRRLICGRCLGQWAYPALACPFCSNDDRALITSFATRDGRYRVSVSAFRLPGQAIFGNDAGGFSFRLQ